MQSCVCRAQAEESGLKKKHEEWIWKPMRGKRASNESNRVLSLSNTAMLAMYSGKI